MDNNSHEWPIGFAMELAMNETAMEFYAQLPEREKKAVVERSRHVKSKSEMEKLVDSIKDMEK